MRAAEYTDHFDFVWECLVEDQYVAMWERGEVSDEEILQEARRSLYRYHRARKGPAFSGEYKQEGQAVQNIPVEATKRERDITYALRKYLAANAAKRPLVQRFRREDLPHGKLLTRDEEISDFLAARLELPPEDVEPYLDVLGVEITSGDFRFPRGLLKLSPEYINWRSEPNAPKGKTDLVIPIKLNAEPSSDEDPIDIKERSARIKATSAARDARVERRLEKEWERSTRWRLEMLGLWLAGIYPWKNVTDAVMFMISGRPPRLARPLSAALELGNATYSITFSPWVSEETVLQAYREIQFSHRRLPQDKTVRVLRFVSEQTDEEGRLPSWQAVLDRWNAANPNEAFSDRSALRRAYRRAVEALVPPYLPLA